jgi:hypothetical protein
MLVTAKKTSREVTSIGEMYFDDEGMSQAEALPLEGKGEGKGQGEGEVPRILAGPVCRVHLSEW